MKSQKRGDLARERILSVVTDRWERAVSAPTIRQIAAETGYSLATIHRHVRILGELGRVEGSGPTLRPKH